MPDTFEEFLNGKKSFRIVKPGGDPDLEVKFKNKTSGLSLVSEVKTSRMYAEKVHTKERTKKRTFELKNDQLISQLQEISPSFPFGLNFYTYTSNYRVLLEILSELVAGIFFLFHIINGNELKAVYYAYSAKHVLLLPDYIYVQLKGKLHINDLIFGIVNFLYYLGLTYAQAKPENGSYLYVISSIKLCIDILLYSTAVAFRENPVSFLPSNNPS